MKSYFIAACLAVSSSMSPIFAIPAIAQTSSDPHIKAAQDMTAWMLDAFEIQTEMMSLFGPEIMQTMYSIINTRDNAKIEQFGKDFAATRQTILSRTEAKINTLPKPEKWNIDARLFSKTEAGLYRATLTQYKSIQDTFDAYSKMSANMVDILTNWEDLEKDSFTQIKDIEITISVKQFEIDNRKIDSVLRALEPSSPNYQFQQIAKQVNLASIVETELYRESDTDIETRQEYGRRMQSELLPINALIEEGRRNAELKLTEFRSIPKSDLNPQEQAYLPKVLEMYKSYETSFDIEVELLETLMNNTKLYLSDRSIDDILPELDENNLNYSKLMDERDTLMNRRLSLLQ